MALSLSLSLAFILCDEASLCIAWACIAWACIAWARARVGVFWVSAKGPPRGSVQRERVRAERRLDGAAALP